MLSKAMERLGDPWPKEDEVDEIPQEDQAKEQPSSFCLDVDKRSLYDRLLRDHLFQMEERLDVRMQRQEDLLRQISDQLGICAQLPCRASPPQEQGPPPEEQGPPPEEQGPTQDVDVLGTDTSVCLEQLEEEAKEKAKAKAIFKASRSTRMNTARSTSRLKGRFILNKWAVIMEDHPMFDRLFCAAIILNTIFVGVQLELRTTNNTMSSKSVKIVNYSFTSIFCLEILVRILAKGWGFFVSNTAWGWDFFDLSLVLMSLLELVMNRFWKSAGIPENTTFMRIIRVTRVLSRFTRLMSSCA